MQIWQYVIHHWFQISIDGVATLNVLAAGARVMGWNLISNECGKLEQAITAMVQASLNRNQSSNNTTSNTNNSTPKAS